MADVKLDELDLELITALQMSPRAPWSQLAGPLGVDAATLARRWARLRDSGVAWVTGYPGAALAPHGALAFVQVACAPQELESIAHEIANHPYAYSVEMVGGTHGLLVSVAAARQLLLVDYLLVLGRIPGVRDIRVHPAQRLYRDGSQWRFDSLSPDQRRHLTTVLREPERAPGRGIVSADEQRLILSLGADGRRSVTALAEDLGKPESSIRRMLSSVVGSGKAVLRCEAALPLTGWATTATFWLDVPPAALSTAIDETRRLRETRMCATTLSHVNLAVVASLHSFDGIAKYEARLAAAVPQLRVVDRSITLRWFKRVGQLLGPDGRRIGAVPMEFWGAPTVLDLGLDLHA
ncbi:AsnC family transcriptional regulator [Nocardia tengchongensis]|uniref:AsnC family transcriptional regulator n=1 Tax=Nocardia tengchongensis TaxID=2055889 RepID=UPI003666A316